jgi:putative colanic acid biosynthesis UDP-glucose lipid carrier transferase
METRYLYLLRFAIAFGDLILINVCFFLAFYILNQTGSHIEPILYRPTMIVCSLIWLASAGTFKLYAASIVRKLESVYRASLLSMLMHACFLFAYFLYSHPEFPKHFIILFYIFMAPGFFLSRLAITAFQNILNRGGLKLAAYFKKQFNINFVGFLNSTRAGNTSTRAQLKQASDSGVDEVFVSVKADNIGKLSSVMDEGEKQCVRLKFVPEFITADNDLKFHQMENFSVLDAREEPLEKMSNRVKKRVFDIIVSSTAIVFICSWLYPLLAIIIKIQSPGPVLFKQRRTGRDNKSFTCYKFRSMRMNHQSDTQQVSSGDVRVTPIGRFIRRTSLDEFMQFFNVFSGHMSIIRPRPHMLLHTQEYREIIEKYMVRHFMKPGISGWAQVNGYRGEIRQKRLMVKRVEHDIWYMQNWSLMLDVQITCRTIMNVFKKEGNAY